jgi:hypothetical protein
MYKMTLILILLTISGITNASNSYANASTCPVASHGGTAVIICRIYDRVCLHPIKQGEYFQIMEFIRYSGYSQFFGRTDMACGYGDFCMCLEVK